MKKKRFLALLLAAIMILTLIPPSVALADFNPGNYVARLQGAGSGGANQLIQWTAFAGPAAQDFQISLWVKGQGTLWIQLADNGTRVVLDRRATAPDGAIDYDVWTLITATTPLPARTHEFGSTLTIQGTTTGGDVLYIDNITATLGGAPYAIANGNFEIGNFGTGGGSWNAGRNSPNINQIGGWTIVPPPVVGPAYTVTMTGTAAANAVITPAGARPAGDAMTLTVTPPTGHYMVPGSLSVTGVPGLTQTATGATFQMPAGGGAVVVNAEFRLIPTYTVTLAGTAAANATITPTGAQPVGTPMTLTVTPPVFHEIVANSLSITGVAGIDLTESGATFLMPAGGGAITVNAEFEPTVFPPVTSAEFSGRVSEFVARGSEWTPGDGYFGVRHSVATIGSGGSLLTLRVTASEDVLYAVVEGANRDTQNVFYISIDGVDGYTFMGRENVSFVVANGWLYQVVRPMSAYRAEYAQPARAVNAQAQPVTPVWTLMPEWFGADYVYVAGVSTPNPDRDAIRLERVGMEYFRTWTGMRLRLDQIGNPDPADIQISWRGKNTAAGPAGQVPVHIPEAVLNEGIPTSAPLLAVGENTITRPRPEGVYFPLEDHSTIFNPLRGGGSNLQSAEEPNCHCPDSEDCIALGIHTTMCRITGDRIPFSESDGPLDGQFYGYAYLTWRELEPASGFFNFEGARMYTKGDYAVVGPNMDQYQCVRGNVISTALQHFADVGAHVQLRFVMDYPFGSPFGYWSGTNYTGGYWDNDPQGLGRDHTTLAMINLRNEAIADIPTWLIERMREEPNRPNPAVFENEILVSGCRDNIPNRPDFDPGDGLYQRMRSYDCGDPNCTVVGVEVANTSPFDVLCADKAFYFWAQRWLTGYFHCTIPNPHGGTDLRICDDGCVPYRRPVGLTGGPRLAAHRTHNYHPSYFWGPEGTWYLTPPPDISGGVGMGPRYEHHLLIYYHERAINALAAEIAAEDSVWNAVANVQLGSLGRWGEFHNWPAQDTGTFPNVQLGYQYVRAVIDAFACNPNIDIGMRYANLFQGRWDLGLFNDQSGHTNNLPYANAMAGVNLADTVDGWRGHGGGTGIAGGGANMANVTAFTGLNAGQYTTAHRHPTHWMHGWTGGEYGDQSVPSNWFWQYVQFDVSLQGDLHRGTMHDYGTGTGSTRVHIMNLLESFRWTHVSNLTPRGPNAGRTNALTGDMQRAHKNNDAAYDNMGYRFTIEEVEITDGELLRNEEVDVRMVVNNRGVAPFYRDWPLVVSFIDSEGNLARDSAGNLIDVTIDEVDISTWMPRHRPITNARTPMTSYRYTDNGARVYYRSWEELGIDNPRMTIPANDGRTEVEFSFVVPDLPDGEFTMAIAILDPVLGDDENHFGIRFHNLPQREDRRVVFEPLVVGVAEPFEPGDYSARLIGDGSVHPWRTDGSTERFNPNRTVSIPNNSTWTLSFWVRGTATGLTVLGESWDDYLVLLPAQDVNAATWTQVTHTFTNVFTSPVVANRTVHIVTSNSPSNHLYVDGFELVNHANPGVNVLATPAATPNHGFEMGNWTNWWQDAAWAVTRYGAPTFPGSNWSIVPNYTFAEVTIDPASTAVTGGGTAAITPAGVQRSGTLMTVTVTPPAFHEIAADSLSVTGVPDVTLAATGATFPMPADGGAIVVNATFAEIDLTAELTALVAEIDEDIAGGVLIAGEWTDASWAALQSALTAARTALEPPVNPTEVRLAYTALRQARSGLSSIFQFSFEEFTGRIDNFNVSEWPDVPHEHYTGTGTGADLTLRATASDDMLYLMVEGADRDTRNVFYISIDGQPGFNRIGRPDVNYIIAAGHLFRPTADQATSTTPEFPGATANVSRISMDYHTHWTGVRVRLDQIGNPDPADITISWQGFSTRANRTNTGFSSTTRADLPADASAMMGVGNFSRPNVATYYPVENFNVITNNPLIGGTNRLVHQYATWRMIQPVRGELHLEGPNAARQNGMSSDYNIHGADHMQPPATRPGTVLNTQMTTVSNNNQHMSLRFTMDIPTGTGGTGDNAALIAAGFTPVTQAEFNEMYPFGPSRTVNAAFNRAMLNAHNRGVADIPSWAIAAMRQHSNLLTMANGEPATCPHNVPFMPDFDPSVPNAIMHIPGDNLYQRMRDPADPHAGFFRGWRDQPLGDYANEIYFEGIRVTDGLFRCTIPDPYGGPDLRVCPNGCIPYRRPAGVRMPGEICHNETHLLHEHMGWVPSHNWGPEGMWYFSSPAISGGIGLNPRYGHHMLVHYVEEVMQLIAAEVGRPNSPWSAIAQIQVGILGHWGEFHTWPTASAGTFPDSATVYPYVRAAVNAFACNENVQVGMRYANFIATKYDLGFFHDEAGQASHFSVFNTIHGQSLNHDNFSDNGWGRGHNTGVTSTTDNLNCHMRNIPEFTGMNAQEYANAARNPSWWMTGGWTGGEWGDRSSSRWNNEIQTGPVGDDFISIMNTITAFRFSHQSSLTPRGVNFTTAVPTTAANKNTHAATDNMGYRFVVEEVHADGVLRAGETVNIDMTVANRGTAPFLRNWPLEVSFLRPNGEVAHTMNIDEVQISQWLPRHNAINNARPAGTGYRYVDSPVTGDPVRITYRTMEELADLQEWPADHPNFIPAHDGRNSTSFQLAIPATLTDGEYTIAIAIIDPINTDVRDGYRVNTNEPGISFHNAGTRADRRLPLTGLVVGAEPNARVWTAAVVGEGSVTPASGVANPADLITITVDDRVGHVFAGATVAGTGIDQAAVNVNVAARTITFPMPAGAPDAPLAVTVTPTWTADTARPWTATVVGGGSLMVASGTAYPGARVELELAPRGGFTLTGIAVSGPGILQGTVASSLDAQRISFAMPAGDSALAVTVTANWFEFPYAPGTLVTTAVNPASTVLTNGGSVVITPAGPQEPGTRMTVTVVAPDWHAGLHECYEYVSSTIEITGIAGIEQTATGATFLMPVNGGEITADATFVARNYRDRLVALVNHILPQVTGGYLRPEIFTHDSWQALWGVGTGAYHVGYTRMWFSAERNAAAYDPNDTRETLTHRLAYLALRAAYEGLVPIEPPITLPPNVQIPDDWEVEKCEETGDITITPPDDDYPMITIPGDGGDFVVTVPGEDDEDTTVTLPPDGGDIVVDDDGNITITVPGDDDDVTITIPGDGSDVVVTVPGDDDEDTTITLPPGSGDIAVGDDGDMTITIPGDDDDVTITIPGDGSDVVVTVPGDDDEDTTITLPPGSGDIAVGDDGDVTITVPGEDDDVTITIPGDGSDVVVTAPGDDDEDTTITLPPGSGDIAVGDDGDVTITVPGEDDDVTITIPGDGSDVVVTVPGDDDEDTTITLPPGSGDIAVGDDGDITITVPGDDGDSTITIPGDGGDIVVERPGEAPVVVPPGSEIVVDDDGEITIISPPSASDDASLSSLDVGGRPLTPVFNPDHLTYTVNVPHATTSVTINAVARHPGATVAVDGPTILAVGNNVFTVTVTAEDGTHQVYTITVVRAQQQGGGQGPTTFTVTFEIGGGTWTGGGALTQNVALGQAAVAPIVTPPEGYRFVGWDGAFANVTSHRTIRAIWAPIAVEYEVHPAYIFGNAQGYFQPGEGATRAHVATILARVKLLEFEQGIEALPAGMERFDAFADVNEGDWFYYYIAWAYDAGLVEGFDGYFRPDDYITREELAAIMVRTLDEYEETAGELPFDDAALISDWALHYVYTAFNEGLVIGDGRNFNPLGYSIRAYVATITNRILGRVDSWEALEAAEVENKPYAFRFPDVSETAWYYPSILAAANDHRLTRDDDDAIDWKYFIR